MPQVTTWTACDAWLPHAYVLLYQWHPAISSQRVNYSIGKLTGAAAAIVLSLSGRLRQNGTSSNIRLIQTAARTYHPVPSAKCSAAAPGDETSQSSGENRRPKRIAIPIARRVLIKKSRTRNRPRARSLPAMFVTAPNPGGLNSVSKPASVDTVRVVALPAAGNPLRQFSRSRASRRVIRDISLSELALQARRFSVRIWPLLSVHET